MMVNQDSCRLGYYSRPLEPLSLEGGGEVGGQAGELAAEGGNALRPHRVPLHCCQHFFHRRPY